jgi:hypothetical protein
MSNTFAVLNAFIEDTCVLTVIAYLLARGRMLTLLFLNRRDRRSDLYLGMILGLVGLTEIIFPGARYPYVTHTLIITFATLIGGLRVGLIAAMTVVAGVCILHPTSPLFETTLALFAGAFISEGVRRVFGAHWHLLRGLIAGMCVQAGVVVMYQVLPWPMHASYVLPHALVSIPANGFGVILLQLVLTEAQIRTNSERHRLEAERAQVLVAEAQLTALRARVHPHFLFNALTSVAALCAVAPARAEAAVLRLSQLMRRALEFNQATPICLAEEIEHVQGYLEIEQLRLGARLQVIWEMNAPSTLILIPAFTLQTLVENAVSHGIASKMEPGKIRIVVYSRPRHTLIAVVDDGVGMTPQVRRSALAADGRSEHGLQIATQQLILFYGRSARIRLFSRPDVGTLAAFAIPNTQAREEGRGKREETASLTPNTQHPTQERTGYADRSYRG